MKIHSLHHGVSFHPSVSSLFFPKGERLQLCHTKQSLGDIISYDPTVNTVNILLTYAMFLLVLYYIINFIMGAVI